VLQFLRYGLSVSCWYQKVSVISIFAKDIGGKKLYVDLMLYKQIPQGQVRRVF